MHDSNQQYDVGLRKSVHGRLLSADWSGIFVESVKGFSADDLLKFVQEQATGLMSSGEDVRRPGYNSIMGIIGQDLTDDCLRLLTPKEKKYIYKKWLEENIVAPAGLSKVIDPSFYLTVYDNKGVQIKRLNEKVNSFGEIGKATETAKLILRDNKLVAKVIIKTDSSNGKKTLLMVRRNGDSIIVDDDIAKQQDAIVAEDNANLSVEETAKILKNIWLKTTRFEKVTKKECDQIYAAIRRSDFKFSKDQTYFLTIVWGKTEEKVKLTKDECDDLKDIIDQVLGGKKQAIVEIVDFDLPKDEFDRNAIYILIKDAMLRKDIIAMDERANQVDIPTPSYSPSKTHTHKYHPAISFFRAVTPRGISVLSQLNAEMVARKS